MDTIEKAELMLGGGIVLPPGLHAFTDGNGAGGVGVAFVEGGEEVRVVREVST